MSFREGDEEFRVLQNWSTLAKSFDIPLDQFLVLNQVHGDGILVVEAGGAHLSSQSELSYDAVVTNRPGLAICIKTADCVPVFIVDQAKKVIAAVHAGWRGTASAISAKVIRLMCERYGSRQQDILAAIGPSIGLCCYEVDNVTAEAFLAHKNNESFLFPKATKNNKWMVDLPEANRRQILDCGIPEANIESSGYCTMCNQNIFFSHRGSGGITGRQINFMMIRETNPCLCRVVFQE
ncbi:MAG: peptidoglycan editing factor PgeF [Syntrophaceae bacterium]|nr:peptidoglycan editing factor PgeF [Syntrophaceae bacterium]